MVKGIKFAFGAAVLLAVLLWAGSIAERKLLPVFTEVEFVVIRTYDTHTDVLFRGVKSRGCLLVGAEARVLQGSSEVSVEPMMLNEDGTQLRPEDQRIATGMRFVRVVRIPAGGDLKSLHITSQCHPLWHTEQVLVKQ